MELNTDAYYKQEVNSFVGYEVWQFTGEAMTTPNGLWYCMENDRGFEWFDDKELETYFTEISYEEFRELSKTLQND